MQIGELWGIEIGVKKIWNGLSWMKKGSCGKLVYAELMWWKAEAYVGLRGKEQAPTNLKDQSQEKWDHCNWILYPKMFLGKMAKNVMTKIHVEMQILEI